MISDMTYIAQLGDTLQMERPLSVKARGNDIANREIGWYVELETNIQPDLLF